MKRINICALIAFILLTSNSVFAGKQISAEFFGAKLGTVVDALSKIANKNIIWDREAVKKKDSLVYLSFRKPVDVDKVFKLILKNYGLIYVKQGNIYEIKVADTALFTLPPIVTKYLGKNVFDGLVELIKSNVSSSAEVKVYPTGNAISVWDTKENINKLRTLVEEYLKPIVAEAEKLAKTEEEKMQKLRELEAKKAEVESLLIKKEVYVDPEKFKDIEDELISALSSYGSYKYDPKTGKLTIIEMKTNLPKISKIIAKAQKIHIRTKCYYVRALEPAELLMTIKENYLSKYGSIIFKSKEISRALGVEKEAGREGGRTSAREKEKSIITSLPKLCITDKPEIIEKIYKDFSELLLKRPYQIAIEARIVQVESGYKKDLGIQWTPSGIGSIGDIGYSLGRGSITNFMFDFPAQNVATGKGASISIGLVKVPNFSLDLQLSALEQIGKSKLLSRPKIVTIDGEGAEISQGIEIPYQSSSAQYGTNVQFKEAVLKLNVIPRTTPDGNIIMNIELTQDFPDFGKAVLGQPPISTKSITSKVIAKDGTTIVIGGILEKSEEIAEYGVPGLRKIPLLGWLFKNKSINITNKELLIFITPKIIYE
ncbi:MAG: pilus assembly protein PilQ [Aquificae bacterium]|nr:pilus assembly protein PilQ [Aquificota bacterium]